MYHKRTHSGSSITGLTLLLMFLLAMSTPMRAQLRSEGPMPEDLKQNVQELYDAYKQRAKEYTGSRVRDRQQLMEASYHINKMLANGHIIYGDPLSNLVSRIADTLLVDYPELRSELRFYTVTSSDVNAFTTPQGMVFINTGLIAQVENEAQLAFIISHEIIHYYRDHGMEELVGKKDKKTSGDLDDEAERNGDFLRRHSRSREMESEADSLGIALFYLNSPYSKDVCDGVFDVLQYGELPFDEIPFDTNWFNTQYFKLNGCWLDTIAEITSRDNYDDSRSTHPNLLTRRQRTSATLDGYYGGDNFVMTSKDEFERLRHLARIECIRQDLLQGNYPRALYNSWVLLKTTPDDATLHRYIVQALYGAATFKNNDKQNDVLPDYKKIQGESQQVYYALRQMTKNQASVIALHKAWEMHMRYPNNAAYEAISADLMEQLRLNGGMSLPDFLSEPPRAESDSATVAAAAEKEKTENKSQSKYDRIKQKRQSQTERKPIAYSLTDLMMTDPTLRPMLREHLGGTAKDEADAIAEAKKDTSAIILFNPCYWIVKDKKDELQIASSMSHEESLRDRLIRMGSTFGHRTIDLSDEGMHEMTNSDQYNDFLTICEWMNEFWLTKGEFNLERTMQPTMDELLYRYGARNINITAVLNAEGLNPDANLGFAIILPFTPLIVAAAFSGTEQTTMVSMIVDARKGKVLTRQSYSYNVADHSDFVDAMLYDTYAQGLRTGKKEPVGNFGHRFALAGGLCLSPSGYQTISAINKYVAFTPWASIEFAIKRDKSLTASIRYHKGYEDVTRTEYVDIATPTGWGGYTYTSEERKVPSSRNMLIAGLGMRTYPRSDFAPLGFYYNYGLHFVHFSTLDGSKSDKGNNTFGIHLGVGRNYTFFRRLLLNWQIDYGYTYGLSKTIDLDYSDNKYYAHYSDAIMANLITIKLGLGFIPF